MKLRKVFFSLFACLSFAAVQAQTIVSAYIVDNNGAFTNIRNAPNGKIVHRISTKATVDFALMTPRNGWWRIEGDSYSNYDTESEVKLTGSKTGYWIHYSCLGFCTRNYGGEKMYLRATPSLKGKVVYTFSEPETLLRPVDAKGDWTKVKTGDGKHEGWIENVWICSNPVTTCP